MPYELKKGGSHRMPMKVIILIMAHIKSVEMEAAYEDMMQNVNVIRYSCGRKKAPASYTTSTAVLLRR